MECPIPPPPKRVYNWLGETKKSIRAREDYEVFMKGWKEGYLAGRFKKENTNV